MAMTVSTVAARWARPCVGHFRAPRPFEAERLGDHGHGERVEFLGQRGDHGRGAGARAAAQAGGDEHHVRALQQLDDAVGVFERRLAAELGVGAGAQAVGDLGAELELVGHLHAASACASVFMA